MPLHLKPLVRFAVPIILLMVSGVLPTLLHGQSLRSDRPLRTKRMTGEQMEWMVFDLVNAERRKAGIAVLRWDPDLLTIARKHSERMGRMSTISHVSDDKGVAERLKEGRFLGWTVVGENIGQNRGHSNPAKAIVDKWLASDNHRKNILDPRWDVTAVGVAIDRRGQVYFTQDFVSFRR